MMKSRFRLFAAVAFLVLGFNTSYALLGTISGGSFTGPVTGKTVTYNIYLPPGYSTNSENYPVIYHLHALNEGLHPGTAESYESALSAGVIRPMIIVYPNGYGNSMWADSKSGLKPAETNVIRELIPYIDSHYRTIVDRKYRVVHGMSMGGFGVMSYISKFSDTFSIAVNYDGALLTWASLVADRPAIAQEIFDNNEAYFNNYSPWYQSTLNADYMRHRVIIRSVVGNILGANRDFRDHLANLNILLDYHETGCPHDYYCMLNSLGQESYAFIEDNLGVGWFHPSMASRPVPADDETGVNPDITLKWRPGKEIADPCLHDLFFGTDHNEVLDASSSVYSPNVTYVNLDVNYYHLPLLQPTKKYYWRVDEIYDSNTYTGQIWSFTTISSKAWNPVPQNSSSNIEVATVLTFNSGKLLADPCSHDVYIGTNYNAVDNATPADHPNADYNNISETTYDPPGLWNMNGKYFWRVDEVYDSQTVKGDIWRFETLDHILLDDFESYADTDDLKLIWSDQTHPDNNSGAAINLHNISPQIRNRHSMTLYGFSSTAGYAETDRTIPSHYSDFTQETGTGVKALYLWFYGVASNPITDPLYVMLEDGTDSTIVYYPDSNDLKTEQWQLWRIDLADFNSLDMSSISNITVGLGDRYSGGGGASFIQVWLDDIDMYSSVCIPELIPQGDIDNDCVVDFSDYGMLANEWKDTANLSADLFADGIVDEKDLDVITFNWLEDTRWP